MALGGFLGLVAILAALGVALKTGDLATTANWAQLLSVVLAMPTLVVPLWLWWRRSARPPAGAVVGMGGVKDVLAGLVADQWRGEAKLRSLDVPHPIPVRWRVTHEHDVLDHHANLPPAAMLFAATSEDIGTLTAKFRTMRRRRLVVLGGPGSGKTTLAVQLLRGHGHEDEPVPVLLSVAGWDTVAFPRLHDWIALRLSEDYPALRAPDFSPDTPRMLAVRRQILPVLDGFDELPEPARAAVITALNRSMDGDDQLILTSRTTEFTAAVGAAGVLVSAMVIEPDPLEPEAAADYLQRCLPQPRLPGEEWGEILAGLRSRSGAGASAAVAEIAATPLGLWLLRSVYLTPGADAGRPDAAELLPSGSFTTVAALRAHLFDLLIPTLISTRRPGEDPATLSCPAVIGTRRRFGPGWGTCLDRCPARGRPRRSCGRNRSRGEQPRPCTPPDTTGACEEA